MFFCSGYIFYISEAEASHYINIFCPCQRFYLMDCLPSCCGSYKYFNKISSPCLQPSQAQIDRVNNNFGFRISDYEFKNHKTMIVCLLLPPHFQGSPCSGEVREKKFC